MPRRKTMKRIMYERRRAKEEQFKKNLYKYVGLSMLVGVVSLAVFGTVNVALSPLRQATPCPGNSCEPLPTQSQGCEHSAPGKNPHCSTAAVVPTIVQATNTLVPVVPPATATIHVPPTATATATQVMVVLPTATPVVATPVVSWPTAVPVEMATATPFASFISDDEAVCDICSAEEAQLYAEATRAVSEAELNYTLIDFLRNLMDGWVPEVRLWGD